MGSRQHSELYTALLEFLERHGQLALDGSAERGMPAGRAAEFISMLEAHHVPIYGLEVWRSTARGYTVDTSSIWYCASGKGHEYADAQAGLRLAAPGPADLVAVQFG